MISRLRLTGTLVCLLVFTMSLSGQQQATQMTLEEAIDYALSNNPSIKNAQIEISDAEQQIIERRASGLPQLTGDVSYQRYLQVPQQPLPDDFNIFGIFGQALALDLRDQLDVTGPAVDELFAGMNMNGDDSEGVSFFLKNNFNASINLDAMIFDGSYFVALNAARSYRSLVRDQLSTARQNVENQVTKSYLPVLLVQENVELLDKNIDNLKTLLFETKELYKAGFAEQLDIDRQQLSLSNLRVERENLVRQKEIALRNLKFTIGYPIGEPLVVVDDIDALLNEATDEELTAQVDYNARPEYAVINQTIALNELNIKLNRAGYLPSLRAFGTYQQTYQGNDFKNGFWAPQSFVGVRLSVPIFDGLNKKAKIQRAMLDLEKVRIQKRELEQSIDLEISNARTSYFNALRRLESQEENLELAQRIYDTTQIKYREGIGSSLEVAQAEQSLYSTQSNYIQALYDLLSAKADLEAALGD